jgi:outer membrane receptor protein involved in Fe transport
VAARLTLAPAFALAALASLPEPRAEASPSAQDAPASTRSTESLVSAGRRPQRPFESPRALDAVYRPDAVEWGAVTSAEALGQSSGVYLHRTDAAGLSPVVRGLHGRRVLLLVDGVRLNNGITPSGANRLLNSVDLFSLSRLEVLRGPGSVLYGSDAIGGAINLVSKRPDFDPRRAWDLAGEALLRFDSASTGIVGHIESSGHVRGLGARIGATLRRFGDLSGGRDTGEQRFSSYVQGDASGALTWQTESAGRLELRYAAVRQLDAAQSDRSVATDRSVYARQFRDLATLEYRYERGGWLSRVDARLSFHSQRQRRERIQLDPDRITREQDQVSAIGASASALANVPHSALHFGADVYHDLVDSRAWGDQASDDTQNRRPRGRYVDGSSYTELGVWAQDEVRVGRRLALELGARMGAWIASIPPDPADEGRALDRTEVAFIGSAYGRYLLGSGLNLIAGVSQGFRAPNLDDLSARGCGDQGYDLPNTELDPERSLTAEIGFKLAMWGIARARLFYAFTSITDPIVLRQVPDSAAAVCGATRDGALLSLDPVRRENAERAQIHALEAGFELNLSRRWEIFSWVAWARGSLRAPGDWTGSEPLDRIPPLNGLLGLRYRDHHYRWFAELALRWAIRQDRLGRLDLADQRICPANAEGCNGTSGYALLAARGGWQPTDWLRLLLALENVTHESYRLHGSGLDGPGINARLGMELTF